MTPTWSCCKQRGQTINERRASVDLSNTAGVLSLCVAAEFYSFHTNHYSRCHVARQEEIKLTSQMLIAHVNSLFSLSTGSLEKIQSEHLVRNEDKMCNI